MKFKKVSTVLVALICAGAWSTPAAWSAGAMGKKSEVVKKTLRFPSLDGLEITADVSISQPLTAPFIVLFHQAGWSRGEYGEIMPKLNKLGFNCMAIDQRSGDGVNGVKNETHARAEAAGKGATYLDALQDMEAAVKFADAKYARGKLLIWGSSYSAALVIKLASLQLKLVDGVLAFSPGEYFGRLPGGSGSYVTEAAAKVTCPVFITSAGSEHGRWAGFYGKLASKVKQSFVPKTAGNHGSRALWDRFEDSGAYWQAVTAFLKKNFLPEEKTLTGF